MRTLFLAAVLTVVMGAPAALAQDHAQQRSFCENADGAFALDVQIGGCTAVIQSGSEPAEYVALAFNNRANAFAEQGDYARAIPDADQAAQLAPQNADYQNDRCWHRAVAGRELEIARGACDRALQLEREHNFLDSRGLVGLKQARWINAWNDYDAAARLAPDTAHYLFGRGLAALNLGRAADAQADMARAAELDAAIVQTYVSYGVTWPGAPSGTRRAVILPQTAQSAAAQPSAAPTTQPRQPEERRSTTCRPRLNNRC